MPRRGWAGSWASGPAAGQGTCACSRSSPQHIITCGGGALLLARGKQAVGAIRRIVESSPLYSQLADMNAALGISQLAALDRFVLARRELAQAFLQSLMRSRHASLTQKVEAENVLSSFPVVLADGMKDARAYALKRGVETIPAFAESAAAIDEQLTESCPRARSLYAALSAVPAVSHAGQARRGVHLEVLAPRFRSHGLPQPCACGFGLLPLRMAGVARDRDVGRATLARGSRSPTEGGGRPGSLPALPS